MFPLVQIKPIGMSAIYRHKRKKSTNFVVNILTKRPYGRYRTDTHTKRFQNEEFLQDICSRNG